MGGVQRVSAPSVPGELGAMAVAIAVAIAQGCCLAAGLGDSGGGGGEEGPQAWDATSPARMVMMSFLIGSTTPRTTAASHCWGLLRDAADRPDLIK